MSLLDTAHEIWATAQLLPGEGIVDGVGRVESLLSQCRKEARKEVWLEAEAAHDHEDVLAPVGNSAYGEAYQDGWIAGAAAYRDELRRMAEGEKSE